MLQDKERDPTRKQLDGQAVNRWPVAWLTKPNVNISDPNMIAVNIAVMTAITFEVPAANRDENAKKHGSVMHVMKYAF